MTKTTPESSHEIEKLSFKDLLEKVNQMPVSFKLDNEEIRQTTEAEKTAKEFELKIYAQKQYLDLQKSYAKDIKIQIWAVLLFQFSFVWLIGFNVGGFTDNIIRVPYMYIGVILQTLANIVALGFIVVQFLFPNNHKKLHPPIE